MYIYAIYTHCHSTASPKYSSQGLVDTYIKPLGGMLFPELVGAHDADEHYAFTAAHPQSCRGVEPRCQAGSWDLVYKVDEVRRTLHDLEDLQFVLTSNILEALSGTLHGPL